MMLLLPGHVILVPWLILTLSGICSAGTVRLSRAIPDDDYRIRERVEQSPLEQALDGLPFNTQDCPWGQIPHRLDNNSTRCCQMISCGPGSEVQICDQAGDRDQCATCPPGLLQPNNVSSLNMVDAKCFMNRSSKYIQCTFHEQKIFGRQFSSMCPVWCQCNVENCYYKADSCNCVLGGKACQPNMTMNPSTGVCEKCLWGSYKHHTGCGPCTLNLTLISLGKPSKGPETTPRQPPIMTSRPVLEEANVTPVNGTTSIFTGKGNPVTEKTQQRSNIAIAVPISIGVCLLLVCTCILVCCLIKKGCLTLPSCCPGSQSEVFHSTITNRSNSTDSDTRSGDDSKALLGNNNTTLPNTKKSNGVPPISKPTTQEHVQTVGQTGSQLVQLLDNVNQGFVPSRQNSTMDGSPTLSSPGTVSFGEMNCNCVSPQNLNFSGTFNHCNFNINQSPPAGGSEPKYPTQRPTAPSSVCTTCNGDDCTCQTSVKTASSYLGLNSDSSDSSMLSDQSDRFNSLPEPLPASREEGVDFDGVKMKGMAPFNGSRAEMSTDRSFQYSPTDDESIARSNSGSEANSMTGASLSISSDRNDACSGSLVRPDTPTDSKLPEKNGRLGLGENKNSLESDIMKNSAMGVELMKKMEQGVGVSRDGEELHNRGHREGDSGVNSPGQVTARPGRGGIVHLPSSPIQTGTRMVAEVRPMTQSGNFANAATGHSPTSSLSYVFLHQDPTLNSGVMTPGNHSDFTNEPNDGGCSLSDNLSLGTRHEPDGDEMVSDISGESPRTFVKQVYGNNDATFVKERAGRETLVKELPPMSSADRAAGLTSANGEMSAYVQRMQQEQRGVNAQQRNVCPTPSSHTETVGGGDREMESQYAIGRNFVIRAGGSTNESDSGGAPGVNMGTVRGGAKADGGRGRQTYGELSRDNCLAEGTDSPQSIGQLNSGRQTDDSFEIDYREMCNEPESDESFELRDLT